MPELTEEEKAKTRQAARQAERIRAACLLHISELAEQGKRDKVMPFLFQTMARYPQAGKIRLWRIDQAVYGTKRKRAIHTIRLARQAIGDDTAGVSDGLANLQWAAGQQKHSDRLAAWLWLMMEREHAATFNPPDGFPFRQLYDTSGEDK